MQSIAEIRAFNALALEMGDVDKLIPEQHIDHQRAAIQALNRYSRIKTEDLTWGALGLTLPDGTLPAQLVQEYMVIERIFIEEHSGND